MNRNPLDYRLSRRGFMRQAACASLGTVTLINALSSLRLTAAATALNSEIDQISDYKTMVCIYLGGGNDSHNMLAPLYDPANSNQSIAYQNYINFRQGLSLTAQTNIPSLPDLEPEELHVLNLGNSVNAFNEFYSSNDIQPLGVHHSALELSELFHGIDGADPDLAFVCNVGTLAAPIVNFDDYDLNPNKRPKDLFSHNSQTMQWMTSIVDGPSATGWGGRIADMLYESGGSSSEVPMAISLTGGSTTFLRNEGKSFSPIGITGAGAPEINRMIDHGESSLVERLVGLSNNHLMLNEYTRKADSAIQASDTIQKAIDTVIDESGTIDGIFSLADGFDLGQQLKMVAKLIAANGKENSPLDNKRQIFFVNVGGYDTHDNHLLEHEMLMAELSVSLKAFRNAVDAVGKWGETVAFTMSDFNRTLAPNTDGLDHAWAGHHIVMGGAINGGQIYGDYPSLDISNGAARKMDASNDGRGRLIPTVSVDQYASKIAEWFGVDSGCLPDIFPNLTEFSPHNNLNFI